MASETAGDADLVQGLRDAIAEANEATYKMQRQFNRQLQTAARVHQSLLPSAVRNPRIDVDVRYLPVRALGSDYFQVGIPDRSGECYVTMCHVSGDGIVPALLASRISSEARHFIDEQYQPADMVHATNCFIYENFRDEQRHVSFIATKIGLNNHSITYSGAGHPGPMLLRPGEGVVRRMGSQHCALGVNPDILSDQSECSLAAAPGDRLLFFTSGIIRTRNPQNRLLGEAGLADIAVECLNQDVFEMLDAIVKRVDGFRGHPPEKDVTLVVAELK